MTIIRLLTQLLFRVFFHVECTWIKDPLGEYGWYAKKPRLFTTYIGKLADSQSKKGMQKLYPEQKF